MRHFFWHSSPLLPLSIEAQFEKYSFMITLCNANYNGLPKRFLQTEKKQTIHFFRIETICKLETLFWKQADFITNESAHFANLTLKRKFIR